MQLRELDAVEILTLQDNYIDLFDRGSNALISRAVPLKDGSIKNSIVAEHGFSVLVKTIRAGQTHSLLFDFGFSAWGVAHNMDALDVDAGAIEVLALSHGHLDHTGGLYEVAKRVKTPMDLVLHPQALRPKRYIKISEDFKIDLPALKREEIEQSNLRIVEVQTPHLLLDGCALFLGPIPRVTGFEDEIFTAYYADEQGEHRDPYEDDTALVFALKGQGLVIITGCAHSGIINTITQARKVTGIERVHCVMGGFHLRLPLEAPLIQATLASLKAIDPHYIVPCHCTGRAVVMAMEREMPGFILNMSGTRLSFRAA